MSVKLSIQSAEELRSEFNLLLREAMREEERSVTYVARATARGKAEALRMALPYIEELAVAEESQRLSQITGPILKEANRIIHSKPETWQDIEDFVDKHDLDIWGDYAFTEGLDLKDRLWTKGVRHTFVTALEGYDGNFYTYIIQSLSRYKEEGELITPIITQATGKFSDYDEALRAAELLTRYINGWPMAPIEEPELWLKEWKGG